MGMKRCENGHFYDEDKHKECPFCYKMTGCPPPKQLSGKPAYRTNNNENFVNVDGLQDKNEPGELFRRIVTYDGMPALGPKIETEKRLSKKEKFKLKVTELKEKAKVKKDKFIVKISELKRAIIEKMKTAMINILKTIAVLTLLLIVMFLLDKL